MTDLRQFLRDTWRLARPYWSSEDRWAARGLLAVVVAMNLGLVYINVLVNKWQNTFFNAIQEKNAEVFFRQLWVFTGLAAAFIAVAVYQLYLNQMLQIRWRRWLTDRYLNAWLSDRTYYRMQLMAGDADNPDQRIAEDVRLFVTRSLSLSLQFLSAATTLVTFIGILWFLSGPLKLPWIGWTVPGYMVWAALLYSIVGTWLTEKVGRRLVRLDFDQQRYEADFRFSLVRLRENAEEVTLLSGERAEKERLLDRFGRVVGNWYGIMQRTKRLTFLTAGYSQVAVIFPFIVVSPLYFAGSMMLGGLMQIASAFGQVQGALSFFVKAYSDIADWKAVLNRLAGFDASMDWAKGLDTEAPRVQLVSDGGTAMTAEELTVSLPTGEEIVHASGLAIGPAERVLVTGPSGSGKTSLFRALGGVWPFGAGTIRIPQGAKLLVLPQRSYLPLGTLRGALAYPGPDDAFTPDEIDEVLDATGLSHLREALDETAYWADRLSMGEQQRLSIARALLQKPDWLFLDEATAALDEPAEGMLYRLMLERLPDAAIVSIGHRSSLVVFHERFLALKPDGKGRHRLTAVSPDEGARDAEEMGLSLV
jgi:putative ATP-binding cassette transporter